MSFEPEVTKIVKRGRLRVGSVSVRVLIVQSDVRHGSGDYEDPPEIQDDRQGVFFDVWYGTVGTPEILQNGQCGFEQFDDAIRHMSMWEGMVWDE
jgi:hypothetical protein